MLLLFPQADIDKAVEAIKKAMQEQLNSFEKESEEMTARNANLIC